MPADSQAIAPRSLTERFYNQPYLLLAMATLGFGGNAVAGKAPQPPCCCHLCQHTGGRRPGSHYVLAAIGDIGPT